MVFASITLGAELDAAEMGRALFAGLNHTMLITFWVLVPLMTADCISREKREGTLGLLFLTPLTVFDVIAGKAGIHVLRALTLFLAALPILGLPMVLGGVDWRLALVAAVAQANAVLLGIAAGTRAVGRGHLVHDGRLALEYAGGGIAPHVGRRPVAEGRGRVVDVGAVGVAEVVAKVAAETRGR